jgi:hypothetical protein
MFSETNVRSSRFKARSLESTTKDLGEVTGVVALDLSESNKFRLSLAGNTRLVIPDESPFSEIEIEIYNLEFGIAFPPKFKVEHVTIQTFGTTVYKFRKYEDEWHESHYKQLIETYSSENYNTCQFVTQAMQTKFYAVADLDQIIPTAGFCFAQGWNVSACYGCSQILQPCCICIYSFGAIDIKCNACKCPEQVLIQFPNGVNSYCNKYVVGPTVIKYYSSDTNNCCYCMLPVYTIAVKKNDDSGYVAHALVPSSGEYCGLFSSPCMNKCVVTFQGINDEGTIFAKVGCPQGTGTTGGFLVALRSTRRTLCACNVAPDYVDIPTDYTRLINFGDNIVSNTACNCIGSFGWHNVITSWVSPCSFIYGSLDTHCCVGVDNTITPCSIFIKNVNPTDANPCYCYTTSSCVPAYLWPTMRGDYFLAYRCRCQNAGGSGACLTLGVYYDANAFVPTSPACLQSALTVNITGLFQCGCLQCTPQFGGAFVTCDGCYFVFSRTRQNWYYDCSVVQQAYGYTCVVVYCRCANSCCFCDAPTCFTGAWTTCNTDWCGYISTGPLHVDGSCYTNRLMYNVYLTKPSNKCFYLCHNGTCWVVDSNCTSCYCDAGCCANVPCCGETHKLAMAFFRNCLLYSQPGGSCWVVCSGKHSEINQCQSCSNGFGLNWGYNGAKTSTNPVPQPHWLWSSSARDYNSSIIEYKPTANRYKQKCRGGW